MSGVLRFTEDEQRAVQDTLFLALTRPAMTLGVPTAGFVLGISGSALVSAWAAIGTWHFLIYFPVLFGTSHVIMMIGAERDYNWFRLKLQWVETKGRAIATELWGGSTLAPLAGWPRTAAELSISA